MENSLSGKDQRWDELQRATTARKHQERRAWQKNFLLLLAATVFTVGGATALARLVRPNDAMGRPGEDRSGSATTRLHGSK